MEYCSPQKQGLSLVFVLGIVAMLPPLAIDMYLPAFLSISQDLKVSQSDVQNTLTLFTLGFAVGQVLWGPLADSFGRKFPIVLGTALFAFIALLLTQVEHIGSFITLRFFQGFFGAAPAVTLGALLRDCFDKARLSKVMSLIMLVSILAPMIAPLLGGYLTVYFHWHAIFYLLATVGILSCILVTFRIPETLAFEHKVPFSLKKTIKNFRYLISQPITVGYILATAFALAGMFAFLTAGSIVYIEIYGVSVEHFGYFFFLNIGTMMLFTLFNAKFIHRLGAERMLQLGLKIQTTAGLWLLLVGMTNLGFWPMAIGVAVFIGVMSIISANAFTSILAHYPELAGTANSLTGMLRFMIAGFVGIIVTLLPTDSAIPMLFTMCLCAVFGAVGYYFLSYRQLRITQ